MRRRARGPGMLLLTASICCLQVGCYKHVVREKGYGARSEEVWEPNVSDEPGLIEQTESFIWGDAESKDKR
ncbi:MAG: hypothetical protein ACYTGE_16670 [Planctomycetota bacterium]